MTLIKCDKLRKIYLVAVCVLIAFVIITVLHKRTSYVSYVLNGSAYLKTIFVDDAKISKSTSNKVYIPDNYTGIPCKYTLNLPMEKRLEKIASYEFEGIENYIEDLFPDTEDQIVPQDPVFVTAFSSNHFEEGLAMIYNFNKMINKNKTFALFVYDIGLSIDNVKQVERECGCEVRRFPFEKFPEHVAILKGYTWKPIIIQLVAREHPFVVWMDTSIRFKTSNIDVLLERAREQGVLVTKSRFAIASQTSIETFRFLNEAPCLYSRTPELSANFIMFYHTPFIRRYLMKPWISCALIKGCMVTNENVHKIIKCRGRRYYFLCHRFDQSILGILMYRLFNKSIAKHFLQNDKYHRVCRGCKHKN